MGVEPTDPVWGTSPLAADANGRSYRVCAQPASLSDRLNAKAHDLLIAMVVVFGSFVVLALLAQVVQLPGDLIVVIVPGSIGLGWGLASLTNLLPLGSFGKQKYRMRMLTRDALPISARRRTIRWLLQTVPVYAWLVLLIVALTQETGYRGYQRELQTAIVALMFASVASVLLNLILVSAVGRALHDLLTGTVVGYGVEARERRTQHGFDVVPLAGSAREGAAR